MTHRKDTLRAVPILAGFLATLLEDAELTAIDAGEDTAGDSIYDCPEATFNAAADICRRFLAVPGVAEMTEYLDAGPDLYLTCAGHGAGFWDGDWEPHGEALTKAAHSVCRNLEAYVGDDGSVYIG
jgi:hypothetical protein